MCRRCARVHRAVGVRVHRESEIEIGLMEAVVVLATVPITPNGAAMSTTPTRFLPV